jgi:periplasmic protein TonB
MSYVSEKKRANPTSLALAIGVNGGIILAVALSPIVAEQIMRTPAITARNIEIEKVPPKPIEQPVEKQTAEIKPIFVPDPIVDTRPNDLPPIRTGNEETTEIATFDGKGDAADLGIDPIIKPVDPPPPPFRAATRDPRYAKDFQPNYPPGLLQKEIEGTATLRVLIGPDGRVREAQVVRASRPDFGKAAVKQALDAWRFKPATRGDTPVEDWQTLSVRFTIN